METKRSNFIDNIKGLMIVWVIITHYKFVYPDDYMRYGFFYWIDMAVPVFMIITGYLNATSFEKIESIRKAYQLKTIVKKLFRFLIPWLPIIFLEIIILYFKFYSITEIARTFIYGGYGPGAYYTPIMIQMIFLGPIIYYVIKRFDFWGFIICFIVTGVWEALSYCFNLCDGLYAIIALRYISLFAFGCYISIGKKKINNVVLITMFLLGVVWQTMLNYIPLHPPYMNYAWARVNLYSTIFVLPIMYVILKKYNDSDFYIPLLNELGKASYNIYLVQMVFYGFISTQLVYKIINTVLQFVICLVFCTTIGYLYYRIEKPITQKVLYCLIKKT